MERTILARVVARVVARIVARAVARIVAVSAAAVFVGSASGCGSSASAQSQYVGTWHYDVVPVAEVNCPGLAQPVQLPPTADKEFADGASFAIVDLSISPVDGLTACDFGYDVKGTTATVGAGQACALTGLAADPSMPPIMTPTTTGSNAWHFTLLGPKSAEEVGTASISNVTIADPSGNPVVESCDYSFMARLTRVSTD